MCEGSSLAALTRRPPRAPRRCRRGKPTNHKVYGEEIAILAGDALLSLSFEYIARETPRTAGAERVLAVIVEVRSCLRSWGGGWEGLRLASHCVVAARPSLPACPSSCPLAPSADAPPSPPRPPQVGKAVGSEGLVGGQVVDIKSEGVGAATVGIDTLRYIHEHKTAALLEAAVVSGALLGGAGERDVERLRKYSRSIGLAFQVCACVCVGAGTGKGQGQGWGGVSRLACCVQWGMERGAAGPRTWPPRPRPRPYPPPPLLLKLCRPAARPPARCPRLQVVDDILDITATTEELGKTAGKDLAVAKATYPSLVGLERSREVRPRRDGCPPPLTGRLRVQRRCQYCPCRLASFACAACCTACRSRTSSSRRPRACWPPTTRPRRRRCTPWLSTSAPARTDGWMRWWMLRCAATTS